MQWTTQCYPSSSGYAAMQWTTQPDSSQALRDGAAQGAQERPHVPSMMLAAARRTSAWLYPAQGSPELAAPPLPPEPPMPPLPPLPMPPLLEYHDSFQPQPCHSGAQPWHWLPCHRSTSSGSWCWDGCWDGCWDCWSTPTRESRADPRADPASERGGVGGGDGGRAPAASEKRLSSG